MAALLFSIGSFTSELQLPDKFVYGEQPELNVEAFMSDVQYEYKLKGSDEWTTVAPTDPGDYTMRAVSINVFGAKKYSEEKSFVLDKKSIEVAVDQSSVMYGEAPKVVANLVDGDTLITEGLAFKYDSLTDEVTYVSVDVDSVKIVNNTGKDVTAAYYITSPKTEITVGKRPLDITIADQSRDYNGQEIIFTDYEYDQSKLAAGDVLQPDFKASSIGVSDKIIYTPVWKIFKTTENGPVDVTHHYDIDTTCGILSVNKDPITITVNGTSFMYDGKEHSFAEFGVGFVVNEADLAKLTERGHTVKVLSFEKFLDAGAHFNKITFAVCDKDGNIVTDNYLINVVETDATVTINKRPIEVVLENSEHEYNGLLVDWKYFVNESMNIGAKNEPIIANGKDGARVTVALKETGHVLELEFEGSLTNVGSRSYQAKVVGIYDQSGENVKDNYSYDIIPATLTVSKRPITITAPTASKFYDGLSLSNGEVSYNESLLVAGHTLTAVVYGNATEIGTHKNVIASVRIMNGSEDVTDNYDIVKKDGELTIKEREIKIFLKNSIENIYDGKPVDRAGQVIVLDENGANGEVIDFVSIEGNDNIRVTLGSESYADKIEFVLVGNRTNVIPDAEDSDTYKVDKESFKITKNGIDITGNYKITVEGENGENAKLEVKQRKLTISALNKVQVGAAQPLKGEFSDEQLAAIAKALNGKTSDTMKYSITDTTSGEAVERIICQVETPLADGVYHSISIVIDSENDGSQLAKVEYAIDPEKVNITYGDQDVTANYELALNSGTLEIRKNRIKVLVSGNFTKIYDGNSFELGVTTDKFSGNDDNLPNTHTIPLSSVTFKYYYDENCTSPVADNKPIDVGTYYVRIESVIVQDADGTPVNMAYDWIEDVNSEEFKVQHPVTKVVIKPVEITIGVYSGTKTYDGIALDRKYTVSYTNPATGEAYLKNGIVDKSSEGSFEIYGKDFTVKFDGNTLTDVDETIWSVVSIAGSDGAIFENGRTTDGNYKIILRGYNSQGVADGGSTSARSKIVPRTITVKMYGDNKIYDGIALDRNYEIIIEGCDETFRGKVGESNEVVIEQAKLGTLTQSKGLTFKFNYNGYEDKTFAGSYSWNCADIFVGEDPINENNYKIVREYYNSNGVLVSSASSAALTIDPCVIDVVLYNESRLYNGSEMNRVYSISINGKLIVDKGVLLSGESLVEKSYTNNKNIVFTFSGESIKDASVLKWGLVGISENGDDIMNSGNYDVNVTVKDVFGKDSAESEAVMVITPIKMTINLNGCDKIYDGKTFNRTFTVTYFDAVDGQYEEKVFEGERVYVPVLRQTTSELISLVDNKGSFSHWGESFVAEFSGSDQTNVCETTWSFNSFENEDHNSENFDVESNTATIVIKKRSFKVVVSNEEKVYDGTALKGSTVTVIEYDNDGNEIKHADIKVNKDGTVDVKLNTTGNTVRITLTGEQTVQGIGTSEASYNVIGVDEALQTIADGNYSFSCVAGKLQINRAKVTVTLHNTEKIYDGDALDRVFDVTVEGQLSVSAKKVPADNKVVLILNNGQKLELTFTHKNIINVEDSGEWYVSNIDFYTDEEDVIYTTNNYDVTYVVVDNNAKVKENKNASVARASLNIIQKDVTVTVHDQKKVYDGLALDRVYSVAIDGQLAKSLQKLSGNNVILTLNNGQKLAIDFDGNSIVNFSESSTWGVTGVSFYIEKEDEASVDTTANYNIKYVVEDLEGKKTEMPMSEARAELSVTRRTVTVQLFDASKIYDGKYLNRNIRVIVDGIYADYEDVAIGDNNIREIVLDNLANQKMVLEFTGKNIVNFGDMSWNVSNVTFYEFDDQNGKYTNEVEDENYAIKYEYYGVDRNAKAGKYSTLSISQREVNIDVDSITQIYNGEALMAKTFSVEEKNELTTWIVHSEEYNIAPVDGNYVCSLKINSTGETLDIVFSGAITDAGESKVSVQMTVKSQLGDTTSNYILTNKTQGKVTVTERSFNIKVEDSQKVYDGTALKGSQLVFTDIDDKNKAYNLTVDESTGVITFVLESTGEEFKITLTGSVVNVYDEATSVASWELTDPSAKTSNYTVNVVTDGKLTVDPRPVNVKTEGAEKIYDGTALTNDKEPEVEAEGENRGLLNIHRDIITFKAIGTITDKGTQKNTVEITSSVEKLLENYSFSKTEADLVITARIIEIQIHDADKEYDGTALKALKYDVVEYGENGEIIYSHSNLDLINAIGNLDLVSTTDILTVTVKGEITNYSEEGVKTDTSYKCGDKKESNYEINIVKEAKLTINKRKITVTTSTNEFIYNGLAQKSPDFEITVGSLVAGHKLEVTASTSVTNVAEGKVENVITSYKIIDTARGNTQIASSNYDITFENGTLQVKPLKIKIDTVGIDLEQIYNGEALFGNGFNYSIVDGDGNDIKPLNKVELSKDADKGISAKLIEKDTIVVFLSSITNVKETLEGNNKIVKIQINGKTVYDADDGEVVENKNYLIEIGECGTLTVKPCEINITTEGIEKHIYSGSAVSNSNFTVAFGGKTDSIGKNGVADIFGENVIITFNTVNKVSGIDEKAINVGTYYNDVATVVIDGKNIAIRGKDDITEEYSENYIVNSVTKGEIVIVKKEITIAPIDVTKTYDGQGYNKTQVGLMKDDDNIYTVGGLLKDHQIELNVKVSYDNVDAVERGNLVLTVNEWKIVDAEGKDVTANYEYTLAEGYIDIAKRQATVTTPTASKPYDGTPLTKMAEKGATVVSGLLEGHVANVVWGDGIIKPGSMENSVELSVYYIDDMGERIDVTGNYEYDYQYGILEVTRRTVGTVTISNANKVNDGKPLTSNAFSINVSGANGLLPGHSIFFNCIGSQTKIGSSKNTVNKSSVVIRDEHGEDVTYLYNTDAIVWVDGMLTVHYHNDTVNNPAMTLPGANIYDPINGDTGVVIGTDVTNVSDLDMNALYEIIIGNTEVSRLYFKQMSYGNYVGNGWAYVPENMRNYTAPTIYGNQYSVTVIPKSLKNFIAPYYSDKLGTSDDVYMQGSLGSGAIMYYNYVENWSSINNSDTSYYNNIKTYYTEIEEELKAEILKYLNDEGLNPANFNSANKAQVLQLIETIAKHMQTKFEFDLNYDRAIDGDNVAMNYLTEGRGTAQHAATAATLMFRALGVPARYTVGYAIDATSDKYVITGADAHAWVEVYVKGIGWRYVEVSPSPVDGGGNGSGSNASGGASGKGYGAGVTETADGLKEKLVIYPKYVEETWYNGITVKAKNEYNANASILGIYGDISKYRIELECSGQRSSIGKTPITIKNVRIYAVGTNTLVYDHKNKSGTDFDKIYFELGQDFINIQYPIEVVLGTVQKDYNGKQWIYTTNMDMLNQYDQVEVDYILIQDVWSEFNNFAEDGGFFLDDPYDNDDQYFIKVNLDFAISMTNAGNSPSIKDLNAQKGNYKLTVVRYSYSESEVDEYGYVIAEGGMGIDVTDQYSYYFCDTSRNADSNVSPLTINKLDIGIKIDDNVNTQWDKDYMLNPFTSNSFEFDNDAYGNADSEFAFTIVTDGIINTEPVESTETVANRLVSFRISSATDESIVYEEQAFTYDESSDSYSYEVAEKDGSYSTQYIYKDGNGYFVYNGTNINFKWINGSITVTK